MGKRVQLKGTQVALITHTLGSHDIPCNGGLRQYPTFYNHAGGEVRLLVRTQSNSSGLPTTISSQYNIRVGIRNAAGTQTGVAQYGPGGGSWGVSQGLGDQKGGLYAINARGAVVPSSVAGVYLTRYWSGFLYTQG